MPITIQSKVKTDGWFYHVTMSMCMLKIKDLSAEERIRMKSHLATFKSLLKIMK